MSNSSFSHFLNPELKEKRQDELKEFISETGDELRDLAARLRQRTDDLLWKHGEQLLNLRDETSKMYGVNFKYVEFKDLGIPLDQILDFREDIKNRRREPFSAKVRRKIVWLRLKADYVYNLIF